MSGTRKPRNMAEFAELLGITPGAASLALRGSDQVSPELRSRVMKAAETTGYVPRSYRRKNERETNENVRPAKPLLLLHGNETDDDPVALMMINTLLKRFGEQRLDFEMHTLEELERMDNPAEDFSGAIGFYSIPDHCADLLKGLPRVTVLDAFHHGSDDLYTINEAQAGELAAEYFLANGYKATICVVGWRQHEPFPSMRIDAFRKKMEAAGVPAHLLRYDLDDSRSFLPELEAALKKCGNAAGFFTFNEMSAYKLCSSLNLTGIARRPGKTDVISCGSSFLLKDFVPLPGIVNFHLPELLNRAVDGLLRRIQNPNHPRISVVMDVELNVPEKEGKEG